MRQATIAASSFLVLAGAVWGGEPPAESQPAGKSAAEVIRANPTDPAAIVAYVRQLATSIQREHDPVMAVARLNEIDAFLSGLPADKPAVREALERVATMVQVSREIVAIRTASLEVLMQDVINSLDNPLGLSMLRSKLHAEIDPIQCLQPEEAARKVAAVKAVLDKVEAAETGDLTKKQLALTRRDIANFDLQIDYAIQAHKRWRELIGTAAPALNVEAWINGAPLTPDDLRGKVLLLDFVAVSSVGDEPWLANLSHLRQWNEKYAEKGLVVIGLTRYSNQRWDDRAMKPVLVRREVEIVPPGEEQTMLSKYFQKQGITHRLALQSKDEHLEILKHFVPMVLPHNVVIDRQGTIRLIHAGGGEDHAKEIAQALAKLLGTR